jgi:hypothetical protein
MAGFLLIEFVVGSWDKTKNPFQLQPVGDEFRAYRCNNTWQT